MRSILSYASQCCARVVPVAILAATAPLAAQDSTRVPGGRIGVLPVIGSAPETGFQYGATVFRVYRVGSDSSTRPSVDQLLASNTTQGQVRVSFQTERWSNRNTWRLRGRVEYQDFPLPFFGVGPSTPDSAEERYRATGPAFHAQVHRRVRPGTYLVTGYRYGHTTIRDVEGTRALARGTVTGSTGGSISQLQGGLLRDTRDHIFSARRGTFASMIVSVAPAALGSDYSFARADLDVRRYQTIGSSIVAGQVQYTMTGGGTPFDHLPGIGADTAIRGYTRGRFRDQQLASAQVELRTASWRGVGLVAFAGVGAVAARAGDLVEVTWQPSVGGGLRFLLFPRERNAIRVDYGLGRGSSGLYIGLNEAF